MSSPSKACVGVNHVFVHRSHYSTVADGVPQPGS